MVRPFIKGTTPTIRLRVRKGRDSAEGKEGERKGIHASF
jgi:hypothetical protein